MKYHNMNEVLVFNNPKERKKKTFFIIIQAVVLAGWISFLALINFQNLFWNFFISFTDISVIPTFYKIFVFCITNIYFGWALSLIFVKIILGHVDNYVNISEYSYKILLLSFFISLLITNSGDMFLLIAHLIIYGFVCYKLWIAIEKKYYVYNPKMKPILTINQLKDTINADRNRSGFIVKDLTNNKCLPWLYIDYNDNYIFSNDVIDNLEYNGIPNSIINKIECLKDFEYENRDIFHSNLSKKLNSEELFKYQSIIMQNTDLYNNSNFTIELVNKKKESSFSSLTTNHIMKLCFDENGYKTNYHNKYESDNHFILYYVLPYDIFKKG